MGIDNYFNDRTDESGMKKHIESSHLVPSNYSFQTVEKGPFHPSLYFETPFDYASIKIPAPIIGEKYFIPRDFNSRKYFTREGYGTIEAWCKVYDSGDLISAYVVLEQSPFLAIP
jgi:hypothetical protein